MLARLLTFQRRSAWLLLALLIINAALEVLSVASVYPFAALASDPQLVQSSPWIGWFSARLGNPPTQTLVLDLAALFMMCFLASSFCNALAFWMQQRYCLSLRQTISSHLLRRYLTREYCWFVENHTGDLAKNVISESDRLTQEVVAKSINIVKRAFSSIGICIALVAINPVVAISSSLTLLVCYRQIYRFFQVKIAYMGKLRWHSNEKRHKLAQESLSAIKEARLTQRAERLHLEFDEHSREFSEIELKQRMVGELPRYLTETLAIVAIVAAFCYLVSMGRDPRLAFPWMGLYIMAIWRLVPNLQELYGSLVDVRLNWTILEKLDPELSEPVDQSFKPIQPLHLTKIVELENVHFRYTGADRYALEAVSLQIPKNSLVALVGKTGSGKTTLADILAGHLEPTQGRMQVDGQPFDRRRWQANIGYVPQASYLSSDTIRRNIALGIPDPLIDPQAVQKAASLASLDDLIEKLPGRFSTLLGERGLSLSGGERQRVGIARALYDQPEVLIFDEATSALDSTTEAAVMTAIEKLAQQKTVVLIAHRLSTVKNCDCIFVLENGRLVSSGSYEVLLSTCPVFQSLARGGEAATQTA